MDYTQLFIKFSLGILTLIIQINAFGKSNLAPTTALDQLQNYVLGGIIGGLIYNQSITVLQFLLVLIVWTLVVFILKFGSVLSYRGIRIDRSIFCYIFKKLVRKIKKEWYKCYR